jgi:hypothetical protein
VAPPFSQAVCVVYDQAPETLLHRDRGDRRQVASTKTDVYMFGSLMFEVLTKCEQQPYFWCTDIFDLVSERVLFPDRCTLDAPEHEGYVITWRADTTSPVFQRLVVIMRQCFVKEPTLRPSAAKLVTSLEDVQRLWTTQPEALQAHVFGGHPDASSKPAGLPFSDASSSPDPYSGPVDTIGSTTPVVEPLSPALGGSAPQDADIHSESFPSRMQEATAAAVEAILATRRSGAADRREVMMRLSMLSGLVNTLDSDSHWRAAHQGMLDTRVFWMDANCRERLQATVITMLCRSGNLGALREVLALFAPGELSLREQDWDNSTPSHQTLHMLCALHRRNSEVPKVVAALFLDILKLLQVCPRLV